MNLGALGLHHYMLKKNIYCMLGAFNQFGYESLALLALAVHFLKLELCNLV